MFDRLSTFGGFAVPTLVLAACVSVQDYKGATTTSDPDAGEPSFPEDSGTPSDGTRRWEWFNPAPTGRTLLGISGTSEKDVWVAGEAGTIAHFDGSHWDLRLSGPEGARYFAVGTRAPDDAWFAGDVDGRTEVEHFDGTAWSKSYPFAGASLGGFSRGQGKRLFAFMSSLDDWSIFELSAEGTWERTDTDENDVFGPAVDIWVTSTGAAWAFTKGAKLLRLAPGSKHWALQAPIDGIPSGSIGLALGGAGAKMCAFYTGPAAGTGYVTYDGTWQTGPSSPDQLQLEATPHGGRIGCLSDGSGIMTYGGDLIVASSSTAPTLRMPTDFQDERLFAAWSLDGARVYTVGSLGAFLTRSGLGGSDGQEKGSTLRRDLLSVDVGTDGALIAASALQPDHTRGGEVVFASKGALAPYSGGGFAGPDLPVAVTMLAANDAWVLSNARFVGVTHFTGEWSVTRPLKSGNTPATEPHAIWAAAKDDVWATTKNAVWHYQDGDWNEVSVDATYTSIHGSAPNDVWFAGEGVAHWDGKALTPVPSLRDTFDGVWSNAPGRVWLWGPKSSVLLDGQTTVPVQKVLHASAEWAVSGIAESTAGDVFVLTKQKVGTQLLWFDPTHEKLVDIVSSDLELTAIRGRGDQISAVGVRGAFLQFAPASVR